MPWSGGSFTRTNGVNTGSTLWAQDRDDGTKILATRHDTNDQDMADGINSTLEKSGSNAATGNLDIGSNRITLVADGTAKTDVATVNQIVSNAPAFQATDTGTANAYVIALSPAITAYAAGQEITFKAGAASTTASTLNVNTLGTKAIKKQNDQDIASGDIESGSIVTVVYDGTSFQMTSQLASSSATSPGGSNTQVQYNSSSAFAGSANFTFDGTSATVANPLYLPDGSASAPALSNTGDTNTGIAFIAADTVGVVTGGTEQFRFGSNPIPGGGKNLVINGDMNVQQRGLNAAILTGFDSTTTTYGPDRFLMTGGGTPQNRGTVYALNSGGPTGFPHFFRYDITTAESAVASAEFTAMQHRIEGYNLNRLSWGNAAAKDVTLSFYMRSPKTGTHCVGLGQSSNRYQVKEFTVASADTWEKHSLTFPGDTSGSMNVASTEGLRIFWPIIAGGAYNVSADTWTAGGPWLKTSNQQNLADSTSNNIDLTGVQLEVGSVATDFAYEDYGTTLNKCYRYYERLTPNTATNQAIFQAYNVQTTTASGIFNYTHKRAAPTLTFTAGGTFEVRHEVATAVCTAVAVSGSTDEDRCLINFTVSSGLTAGSGCIIRRNGTDTTYIEVSAEL